jgi:hypothetical protein
MCGCGQAEYCCRVTPSPLQVGATSRLSNRRKGSITALCTANVVLNFFYSNGRVHIDRLRLQSGVQKGSLWVINGILVAKTE